MEADEDTIIDWLIERNVRTMCDFDAEYVMELARSFPVAVRAIIEVLAIPSHELGSTREFNDGRAYALKLVRKAIADVMQAG